MINYYNVGSNFISSVSYLTVLISCKDLFEIVKWCDFFAVIINFEISSIKKYSRIKITGGFV